MNRFVDVALPVPAGESFTYFISGDTACMPGSRVEVLFRTRKLVGHIVHIHDTEPETTFIVKPVSRVIDPGPLFGEYQIRLAQWIAARYFCSFGEALHMMLPGGKRQIAPEGLFTEETIGQESEITLSEEQENAIEGILSKENAISYVYGITGSGKTEVFLQCARRVIDSGKSVIYLVPEIALTHQLIRDIGTRFGPIVGVIHSRLTPSQKLDQWKRIISGEYRFVIGARSAVFAPVIDPGLVIMDEEHENSYKSGSCPRYHARQVAMKICGDTGAKLVMGSATPSVEAFYLVQEGAIRSFHLTQRLSGGHMPDIEIVDLKGKGGPLSPELVSLIHRTHEEGCQTILFLNRRGFSYFFHCKSCGYELKCKNCSVPMTYHKSRNRLVCHYCGYSREPVDSCPECGSLETGYSGFGTQKIEDDIRQTFPAYVIARLDTDSAQKRGELEHIISQFRKGKIDILLGTQMVAKGLNFPGVKLVGIVQADTGLKLPDFRAAERTFSLITQVAGRAGRFMPGGKVIVQTFMPENPAINLAARYALEEFYEKETETRRVLSFPPFTRIMRIVVRGKDQAKTEKLCSSLAGDMITQSPEGIDVLGPSECPLAVISANFRYHVLLRGRDYGLLHSFVNHYYRQLKVPSDVYVEYDPDPQSLL